MKRIIKYLILTSALSTGSSALAAPELSQDPRLEPMKRLSVKTESRPCSSKLSPFRGSGLLFRRGGKAYVISSDHVVLHSNEGICHSVESSAFGKMTASLAAYDWGRGLALLELPDQENRALLEELPDESLLAEDSDEYASPFARVFLVSYPLALDQPLIDGNAKVVLARSKRHWYPELSSVLELAASGEYGMSGGPVFSSRASDGKIAAIGLLSSRYLIPVMGGRSLVGEFTHGDKLVVNHLIAIRSQDIRSWLKSYFSNPGGAASAFSQSADSQRLKKTQIVRSGSIEFSLVAASPAAGIGGGGDGAGIGGGGDGAGIGGGGDGAGIGGGDGAGIGGGDGAGIGGEPGSAEGEWPMVRMTLAQGGESPTPWFLPSAQEWHDTNVSRLMRRQKLSVPYFLRDHQDTDEIERIHFRSLGEFFSLLRDSSLKPVLAVEETLVTGLSPRSPLVALGKTAKEISALLPALKPGPDEPEGAQILKDAAVVVELIQLGNSALIRKEFVERLASGDGPGWKQLFSRHFTEAVQLLRLLRALEEEMRRIA